MDPACEASLTVCGSYVFLVSKETVVLHRWGMGDQSKSLVLSNELIKVELPP